MHACISNFTVLKSYLIFSDHAEYFNESSGNISSSNYQISVSQGFQFDWTISVQEGYKVGLKFKTFNLPSTNGRCSHGYIEYGTFLEDDKKKIDVGRQCRSSLPDFVSNDNRCWIYFLFLGYHSNSSSNYGDFWIQYDAIPVKDKVNDVFSGT